VNSDEILKAELAKVLAECERLREENARLRFRVGEDLKGDHQDVERPSLNGDVNIAVQAVVAFEEARGSKVENVEGDTRGFDLISRCALSVTEGEQVATRFIEVKGRAAVGEIALTANEYKTALRLSDEYWLYVVFNCASQPKVTTIQNPARFDWQPLSKIDCYRLDSETILKSQFGSVSKHI